ncbi:MAG: hypothetical protein ACLTSX_10885 [Collinsella sp.]
MDLRKNVYKADADRNGIIAKLPGGAITLSIPVGIIAAALSRRPGLAFYHVPAHALTRTGMMIFKGCMCAVVGALSGYIVVTRTTAGFEPESK